MIKGHDTDFWCVCTPELYDDRCKFDTSTDILLPLHSRAMYLLRLYHRKSLSYFSSSVTQTLSNEILSRLWANVLNQWAMEAQFTIWIWISTFPVIPTLSKMVHITPTFWNNWKINENFIPKHRIYLDSKLQGLLRKSTIFSFKLCRMVLFMNSNTQCCYKIIHISTTTILAKS